jgi:Mg/Co/Ni transporter MgtE
VLDSDVEGVAPDAPLGRVTRILATYDLLCVPVLDAEKRLLGAISVDDVLDHMLPDDWRETDDDVDTEQARAALAPGSLPRPPARGGATGVTRG